MKSVGPCLFVTCACVVAGCRPSFEVATKAANDFDDRTHASAIAGVEADRSLGVFEPPLRSVPAADVKPAEALDAALRGCLFDVGGEIAFNESCGGTDARDRERRYYRNGTKVVIVRLVAVVEDEASYLDEHCLQSGLSGGYNQQTAVRMQDANQPPEPPGPSTLRVLGAVTAAGVSMRDVRYSIHVVAKVCTGTYATLGYPP